MKKFNFLLLIFLFVFLVACSGTGGRQAASVPVATATPVSTQTPLPGGTATSEMPAAATPAQTAVPLPSATLETAAPTLPPAPQETATAAETPAAAEPTASSSATPTAEPEASPEPAAESTACQEKAAFFADLTIPDGTFFRQGETFTKTWRFRNEGTCLWTPEYKVVFNSGEIMDAPLSAFFPATVAPGEQMDVSIEMSAPTRGGTYQSNWEFEDPAGRRFGTGSSAADVFWVQIAVRFLDQNDQPQPDPASQPASSPSGCAAQADPSVEAQVLELINQARAAGGVGALSLNPALTTAARVHSTDMACNDFVSHSGSDGSNWADRITAQGYAYGTFPLENIYVGSPQFGGDAQGAVTWWLNSQVHHDNIMNGAMSETGIGYVFDPNSEYGGYYTMVFARP